MPMRVHVVAEVIASDGQVPNGYEKFLTVDARDGEELAARCAATLEETLEEAVEFIRESIQDTLRMFVEMEEHGRGEG